MTQPPASPQQSPYRCETCEYGKRLDLDSKRCDDAHVFACSKQNGRWMPSQEDGSPIAIVGCFSHSANTGARVTDMQQVGTFATMIRSDGVVCHMVPVDWVSFKLALLNDGVERK